MKFQVCLFFYLFFRLKFWKDHKLLKQKEALSKKVNNELLLNQLHHYVEQRAEGTT